MSVLLVEKDTKATITASFSGGKTNAKDSAVFENL